MDDGEESWCGWREACGLLGVSRTTLGKLVREGKIGFLADPSKQRGTKYSARDIGEILEARVSERVPLYGADGSSNLKGRVADWVDHRFLDRADACWFFLLAHGYLDRDESRKLRARIIQDIARSQSEGKYLCMAHAQIGE